MQTKILNNPSESLMRSKDPEGSRQVQLEISNKDQLIGLEWCGFIKQLVLTVKAGRNLKKILENPAGSLRVIL